MTTEEAKKFIEEKTAIINSGRAKKYLLQDMLYPVREKENNIKNLEIEIAKIEKALNFIENLVKGLKNRIGKITDRTLICASYLILCKIIYTFRALIILARNGFSHEVMELVRSIEENTDLISLFHHDKIGDYLNKWYDGEIINNSKSRLAIAKFMSDNSIPELKNNKFDLKKIIDNIYRMMSQYTHCGYGALIDAIDPFEEDFDFQRRAGFHFTLNNFHMVRSAMISTITALKIVFGEIGDMPNYEEINKLLIDFRGMTNEEALAILKQRGLA